MTTKREKNLLIKCFLHSTGNLGIKRMVTETCTSLSSWKNPSSQLNPFSKEGKKEKPHLPKKGNGTTHHPNHHFGSINCVQ